MASILKVDDLRGNTAAGNITITSEGGSATMQLQQGMVKGFVGNYNLSGGALGDSFNVSSVTDYDTGYARPNWSNAFSNANYAHVAIDDNYGNTQGSISGQTTTQARAVSYNSSWTRTDCRFNTVAVGDLA